LKVGNNTITQSKIKSKVLEDNEEEVNKKNQKESK
jgi:hypothetical protein